MRRWTLLLTAVAAVTLALAGCGGSAPAPGAETAPTCGQAATPGGTPKCADLPAQPDKPKAPPANQGITYHKLNYTVVRPEAAPTEVREAWQQLKAKAGHKVMVVDGETWVIVTSGEKPSGGYGVEIHSVGEANGKLTVAYAETAPQPGAIVTMAITYPSAIIKFQNTANLPVELAVTGAR